MQKLPQTYRNLTIGQIEDMCEEIMKVHPHFNMVLTFMRANWSDEFRNCNVSSVTVNTEELGHGNGEFDSRYPKYKSAMTKGMEKLVAIYATLPDVKKEFEESFINQSTPQSSTS